jgi:hypothetical protein
MVGDRWSLNRGVCGTMLKWKNMRSVVLLATVILGLSSVFVYLSVRRATPGEGEKSVFTPLEYPIPGGEVSLDEAQASLPFKITLPTNLGPFIQLRLHRETSFLAIIYAAAKPPSDASHEDVCDQNGIILYEAPLSEAFGTLEFAENNYKAMIETDKNILGGVQPVTINGYFGCAGGNVEHCVTWCTETTYYSLSASNKRPLQQLIEIAQSIPVN